MATLSRKFRFEAWAPNIGENLELAPASRLYLGLAVGLTAEQISEARAKLREAITLPDQPETEDETERKIWLDAVFLKWRTRHIDAIGAYVKVNDGPHVIDGVSVATLDDFLKLLQSTTDFGQTFIREVFDALWLANTADGHREVFSQRPSGGVATTPNSTAPKTDAK